MPSIRQGLSTSVFGTVEPAVYLPLTAAAGIMVIEASVNCYKHLESGRAFGLFQDIVRSNGLTVNSIHVPFSDADDISQADAVRREAALHKARVCLKRAAELGARCIVIHPSAEPIADRERAARTDILAGSLAGLAGDAPDGVRIAVELLPRTCLCRESREIMALLDRLDHPVFGICQDVNHANLREDLADATRAMGDRIITLHLSDNDGKDERHWLPGKGIIPWQAWQAAILAAGYDGPFLYEVRRSDNAAGAVPGDKEMLQAIRANFKEVFKA